VDWAFRLAEIDINSMIYEEPPLWGYGKTTGDLETRRAVELMDSVKNKKESSCKSLMIEIEEMTEVTPIAQYAEMSVASNLAPCPGCNVFHLPGDNGGVCPPRNHNSPKVLGLLGYKWQKKVRGMMIGTHKMRVQPSSLKDVLLNASLSPIKLITPPTTKKEI
jgi:hypothetical protein